MQKKLNQFGLLINTKCQINHRIIGINFEVVFFTQIRWWLNVKSIGTYYQTEKLQQ